jgi:putative ABC transport system permease protein
MYRNYIKIALRNLFKNKAFSFINLFGLATGISLCLLTILILKDAHSFDLFHPESDRIYRITTTAVRKSGGEESYAPSPYLIAQHLKENYRQVELWTPLVRRFQADVQKEGERINRQGLFTDATFFEMFGFSLATGTPKEALNEPYSLVLTDETARIIFGNENPVGQFLNLPAYSQPFKVTGVLTPASGKTHLEFDALSSIATLKAVEQEEGAYQTTNNYLDYYTAYNFIRLNDASEESHIAGVLDQLAKEKYAGLSLESRDKGYKFSLQPLSAITPGPIYSYSMGRSVPVYVLWFLAVLGMVVILSACFNYTNLTIARAFSRAREVGVRKALGANRRQLFGQFICESVVMALLSLMIGLALLKITIPAFNQIETLAAMDINLRIDWWACLLFVGFTLLVGLLAGLLPASVLSGFSPITALQKLENVKLFRQVGLRKVLLTAQFSISLVFILVLSIAWKQIDFAIQKNFASDRSDIINVEINNQEYGVLLDHFQPLSEVKSVSASSHLMGTWQDSKMDVRLEADDEALQVRDYTVDHHYLQDFGLEIIAGKNFPAQINQQHEVFAIVNEDFLRQFEMGSPGEAVGRSIIAGDSTHLTIRGVVKDFMYKPLAYGIEPMLLRYNPQQLNVMHLTIESSSLSSTIQSLEESWKSLDHAEAFNYTFYDETIAANYADLADLATILGYCGLLGVIIACLGLLGMAIYTVETRAKEIGIRKIIGATETDLIRLLSKGFVLLLLISVALAVPSSYYVGKLLLQNFSQTIPLNGWVFLPGIAVLLGLAILTIASQTIRAATANPSDALRQE